MSLEVLEPKVQKQLSELNRKCTKKLTWRPQWCRRWQQLRPREHWVARSERRCSWTHLWRWACGAGPAAGRARWPERPTCRHSLRGEEKGYGVRRQSNRLRDIYIMWLQEALTAFTISLTFSSNCLTRNVSLTLSVTEYYYVVSLSSCASCEVLSTRNIPCPKGLHRKPADYVLWAETRAANCLTSVAISMFPAWLH